MPQNKAFELILKMKYDSQKRTGARKMIEPLNGYFVGLDKYESIYLGRSSTEYPLRGFAFFDR